MHNVWTCNDFVQSIHVLLCEGFKTIRCKKEDKVSFIPLDETICYCLSIMIHYGELYVCTRYNPDSNQLSAWILCNRLRVGGCCWRSWYRKCFKFDNCFFIIFLFIVIVLITGFNCFFIRKQRLILILTWIHGCDDFKYFLVCFICFIFTCTYHFINMKDEFL